MENQQNPKELEGLEGRPHRKLPGGLPGGGSGGRPTTVPFAPRQRRSTLFSQSRATPSEGRITPVLWASELGGASSPRGLRQSPGGPSHVPLPWWTFVSLLELLVAKPHTGTSVVDL